MGSAYIGEIRLVGFNFVPQGWAFCNGALLPISENATLFTLIGTIYGGDGVNTFALPDLQGRAPIHQGYTNAIGQFSGTETVTVSTQQLPSHNHPLVGSAAQATGNSPSGTVLATTTAQNAYVPPTEIMAMTGVSTATGGGQPHNNMQPFLVATFIIALYGIYPSQG